MKKFCLLICLVVALSYFNTKASPVMREYDEDEEVDEKYENGRIEESDTKDAAVKNKKEAVQGRSGEATGKGGKGTNKKQEKGTKGKQGKGKNAPKPESTGAGKQEKSKVTKAKSSAGAPDKKVKGGESADGEAARTKGPSDSGDSSNDNEDSSVQTYQQVVQILDRVQINAEEPLKGRLENEFHESLRVKIINTIGHVEKFSTISHCFDNLDESVQMYAGDAVEENNNCKGACIDTVQSEFRRRVADLYNRLSPCLERGLH